VDIVDRLTRLWDEQLLDVWTPPPLRDEDAPARIAARRREIGDLQSQLLTQISSGGTAAATSCATR
jgi:hypothetical protein